MNDRLKEIKDYIMCDLYNPYPGQNFRFSQTGDHSIKVEADCWILEFDLHSDNVEVETKKGCVINKYDCKFFMEIADCLPDLRNIWEWND